MTSIIITGGIASGKSTICKIFKGYGCKIIDADKIAQNLLEKDNFTFKKIVNCFGSNILKSNKRINRVKLGNIIFNNEIEREKLNAIIHPPIIKQIKNNINNIRSITNDSIIIIDIPLFFEVFKIKKKSKIILVYVPKYIQINRLMKRDNCNKSYALSKINSQMPIKKKKSLATIIINNKKSLKHTTKITRSIFKKLKSKHMAKQLNSDFLFDS